MRPGKGLKLRSRFSLREMVFFYLLFSVCEQLLKGEARCVCACVCVCVCVRVCVCVCVICTDHPLDEEEDFNMVKTIIIAVCSAGAYLALVIGLTAFCSYRLLTQCRSHKALPCE